MVDEPTLQHVHELYIDHQCAGFVVVLELSHAGRELVVYSFVLRQFAVIPRAKQSLFGGKMARGVVDQLFECSTENCLGLRSQHRLMQFGDAFE